MSTSDQAKQLLADYCKSIPPDEFPAYDYSLNATEEEEQLSAWKLASNPKKWKRINKYKDAEGMIMMGEDKTLEVQVLDSQGQYSSVQMHKDNFVLFREFICAEDKLDTSVRYLVLEDKQGKLFVGENIGD